jgi:hypothetical protein
MRLSFLDGMAIAVMHTAVGVVWVERQGTEVCCEDVRIS